MEDEQRDAYTGGTPLYTPESDRKNIYPTGGTILPGWAIGMLFGRFEADDDDADLELTEGDVIS